MVAKVRGRPGHDPADLLKLWIHGYLNRVRSSRRLEAETHRNIEVIRLLRRLTPDFKTIADFRRKKRAAFRQVFREYARLCREPDLFGRALVAVDGARIKAVNSRERNFTRAKLKRELEISDGRLARCLKDLDEADRDGDGKPDVRSVERLQEKIALIQDRRARLESHARTLEESGEDQLSLTAPAARAMHTGTRIGVGYNIQIAVDTKNKSIAGQQVHNTVGDPGLLAQTAQAAKEVLDVDRINVVADRGCFRIEDIEACEAAAVTPYVPKPNRSPAPRSGHFPRDQFSYDAEADVHICPGKAHLSPRYKTRVRDTVTIDDCNRAACRNCELRTRCTKGACRKLSRFENEAVFDRMAERCSATIKMRSARQSG